MSISGPFIRRPVGTTLLTAALVLAGVLGFRLLPVAPLPQVDFPTIQIVAGLPGASPETMASAVATPLERQFGRIAGVTEMTSTSFLGATTITLQFDLARDINGAARDVQAAIAAAAGQLPPNMPSNPTYRKVNPADAPILIIALTSDTVSRAAMYDVASTVLQQKLSQLEGVGQVFVGGGSLPAVRVELNPTSLAHYGIGLEGVRNMLANANVNRPKGQLHGPERSWEIRATDQLRYAAEYAPLIVAWRNGAAIRLSDVAYVRDEVEDLRALGLSNGKPAILLVVFRQPGVNIIDTVDRIRAEMPILAASVPGDVNLNVALDQTVTIRASVHDVEVALTIAVGLVVLVVFLFLRDWRATLIPGVVVPVSLVGTFGVMWFIGYSIDNLSLMALTIATGFVVDDAIVVVENVIRHLEAAMPVAQAALVGAQEIGFTVLSISVSLIAVFIPIFLMGGLVGRLFREFAAVMSIAIVISLLVSLTTTPMMCALLLRGRRTPKDERRGRIVRFYDTTLSWTLRHPATVMLIAVITFAVNVYLFVVIPKGFFPQQDNGRIAGVLVAAQDVSFQAIREKMRRFVDIVKSDPAVETATAFTGGGGGRGTTSNTGRMFISLKPRAERKLSADEVIARLRPKLAQVPGATLFLQAMQDVRLGGRVSQAQYQYTLVSDNLEELNAWAPRLVAAMRKMKELRDISSDQQDRGLEVPLEIDPAAGLDDLHDAEPVPRRDGGGAGVLAEPGGAVADLRARGVGQHGAAHRGHAVWHEPGAATGESPGPLPGHHRLLQPGARRRAGRRGDRDPRRGQPHGAARRHPRQLHGHRAGLPGRPRQPAAADPGRAGGRLHRARHPLREPRPPLHDSLHAALGGRGRAAGAARHRHRAQHHRGDRHHLVDRHRQEERHHGHRRRS